jgi:hypothetical protein
MTKKSFVSAMIGVVALYSVPVAPAFAAELSAGEGPPSFQALSGLPDERRIELAAMTDEQLDAVEGAAFFWAVGFRHLNASVIKAVWLRHLKASVHKQRVHRHAVKIWQVNVSTKSHNTHQSNKALVFQRH